MHIVNMAGKMMKFNIRETDLLQFPEEIIVISPEEQRKHAWRNVRRGGRKFPGLLKLDKNGRPVIYGEKEKDN